MTKKEKQAACCSFCGRPEESVEKLISGPDSFICDKCIRLCIEIIDKKPVHHELKLLKPQEIKLALDEYVIGQERAKKTIAVAVYNHYKRIRAIHKKGEVEYSKSNVMLLGPTGSGKTLIARTLAQILDVPFAIADATTLTEAGYVGEDVENIILRLIQAADYNISRAEIGIIYVDEIDKIARRTENVSITRDVSGEGVQQALLKILEGITAKVPPQGGRKHPQQEYIKINTEHILFICGGAFVGLDNIVKRRMGAQTIGYITPESEKNTVAAVQKQAVQVEPEDLIKFGMIPEFIGRLPVATTLEDLTEKDLVRIMIEPKNCLLKQYQKLLAMEDISLSFSDSAMQELAHLAIKRKSGARGLRAIVERLMLD